MVQLGRILWAKVRNSNRRFLKASFRDSLRVYVSGGAGGNGYPKFGGVGGRGGDVKIVATDKISLDDVYRSNKSKRYIAPNGRHSSHNFILGPPGDEIVFEVPIGVKVVTELGKPLGELNKEGEELIVAKGGTGGHSKNGYFGVKGQAYPINLDLQLIADIGLVGFPNAGKSTLLRAISHAKPKIASYPFTTVKPNVGILMYKDLRQISMADLPGLIEGAYANKGMGHAFLKHVERTKLLLLVVDVNGFQLSPQYPHRTCLDTVLLLNKELELYNEDLLNKPSMILINKMDSEGAQDKFDEIKDKLKHLQEYNAEVPEEMRSKKLLKFMDIVPISAKESSTDINTVKLKLRNLLDVMADVESNTEEDRNLFREFKEKLVERGPKLI